MDLAEMGCGAVDRIHVFQVTAQWRAFVNVVMNVEVP
jgi:hypothetical protein